MSSPAVADVRQTVKTDPKKASEDAAEYAAEEAINWATLPVVSTASKSLIGLAKGVTPRSIPEFIAGTGSTWADVVQNAAMKVPLIGTIAGAAVKGAHVPEDKTKQELLRTLDTLNEKVYNNRNNWNYLDYIR